MTIAALILFIIAAVLTALSWVTAIDTRIAILLTAIGGILLCVDAGVELD